MNIEIIQAGGLPEMGAFIGHAISTMPPEFGQAHLGAVFANIVGNIPAEEWEKIKQASQLPCECGDPDCKVAITAVIEAGEKARKQFEENVGAHIPENPDEKGFSE